MTHDRLIVVRDDLLLVLPATESAADAWQQMLEWVKGEEMPVRVIVAPPGAEAEDWRGSRYIVNGEVTLP